ncbi:MAG: hypothetical protein R2729_23245 [Bryobacteraceae bacterium]
MAQVNMYVGDDLAGRLRAEAEQAGMPLSRYIVELISKNDRSATWPEGYFEQACGFLTEDFPEIPDLPPDEVEPFEVKEPRSMKAHA